MYIQQGDIFRNHQKRTIFLTGLALLKRSNRKNICAVQDTVSKIIYFIFANKKLISVRNYPEWSKIGNSNPFSLFENWLSTWFVFKNSSQKHFTKITFYIFQQILASTLTPKLGSNVPEMVIFPHESKYLLTRYDKLLLLIFYFVFNQTPWNFRKSVFLSIVQVFKRY